MYAFEVWQLYQIYTVLKVKTWTKRGFRNSNTDVTVHATLHSHDQTSCTRSWTRPHTPANPLIAEYWTRNGYSSFSPHAFIFSILLGNSSNLYFHPTKYNSDSTRD